MDGLPVLLKKLKHQKQFLQQHSFQFSTARKQNLPIVCQALHTSIRHLQQHKKCRDAQEPPYLKVTSKELLSKLINLLVYQLMLETNFWQPMVLSQKEHKLKDLYDFGIQFQQRQELFGNEHTKALPYFFVQYVLLQQIHQTHV